MPEQLALSGMELPARERRPFNRSVLRNAASAEATTNRKGERTVTVRATFAEEGYSDTETTHLSEAAAWDLFSDLADVFHIRY